MDYHRAILNLTDILVDEAKFKNVITNVFDSVGTEDRETLDKEDIEMFVKDLITGVFQNEEYADFREKNKLIFAILDESENGKIKPVLLSKFLRELFKQQIKQLQMEQEKKEQAELKEKGL